MSEKNDVELITKALVSDTRRKILFLLAQNEDYPFSLASRLNISPRAVMQNLNILEEAGLIEKHLKKSSLGPPRTYYRIKRGLKLSINLTPRSYRLRIIELPSSRVESKHPEIQDKIDKFNELDNIVDKNKFLEKSVDLINDIDKQIEKLEKLQCELIKLKDKIFDKIDNEFNKLNAELPITALVKSLLDLGGRSDIFELLKYHMINEEKLNELLELAKKMHIIKEKKIKSERGFYFL